MSNTGGKGLGRGLSALIPSAADREHDGLGARDRLFHDIVNAGFDLLEELTPLAVCAYVHLPRAAAPVMLLRNPHHSSLTASEAYSLFVAFARVAEAEDGPDDGPFTVGTRRGRFRRSAGAESTGVHFLAPPGDALDAATWATLSETAAAFASVCHQFPVADGRDLPRPRLVVEVENGKTSVDATVEVGGTPRQGRGWADDAQEAVARAVLDALDADEAFSSIADVALGDRRAVLVALEPAAGPVRLGISISSENVLQAAAIATLRAAVDHLRS